MSGRLIFIILNIFVTLGRGLQPRHRLPAGHAGRRGKRHRRVQVRSVMMNNTSVHLMLTH